MRDIQDRMTTTGKSLNYIELMQSKVGTIIIPILKMGRLKLRGRKGAGPGHRPRAAEPGSHAPSRASVLPSAMCPPHSQLSAHRVSHIEMKLHQVTPQSLDTIPAGDKEEKTEEDKDRWRERRLGEAEFGEKGAHL